MRDVDAAVCCMARGGVILYPTDTVWGIGCDATNAEAVGRVFSLKRRHESKALITLVASPAMLSDYVACLPEKASEIIEDAGPGNRPVTLVLQGACNLAHQVVAEDGTAGFRVASELYSKALCEKLGRPVVSTSANISGEPSAKIFDEISAAVIAQCDYVAKYRRDDNQLQEPSKIVKINSDGTVEILRP